MNYRNMLTVSVGIPAYNEEANIKKLLESLLSQKAGNFELKEIIVVSDGSSDRTAAEVKSVSDPRIVLSDDGLRRGQAARQNEILNAFHGDVLVLMNADVLPKNEMFLHYMVEPFYSNPNLGIVSNGGTPLPAKTFFEKVVNFSAAMRHDMVMAWNGGNNAYLCHGRNRAFSAEFAKRFRFGPAVSEDAYSYFKCKAAGFDFLYAPEAGVWYRSPQNMKDHIKQSSRFFQGNRMLETYFPAKDVRAAFQLPPSIAVKAVCKYFFKNPFMFAAYAYVLFLSKIKALAPQKNSNIWEPSASSKNL